MIERNDTQTRERTRQGVRRDGTQFENAPGSSVCVFVSNLRETSGGLCPVGVVSSLGSWPCDTGHCPCAARHGDPFKASSVAGLGCDTAEHADSLHCGAASSTIKVARCVSRWSVCRLVCWSVGRCCVVRGAPLCDAATAAAAEAFVLRSCGRTDADLRANAGTVIAARVAAELFVADVGPSNTGFEVSGPVSDSVSLSGDGKYQTIPGLAPGFSHIHTAGLLTAYPFLSKGFLGHMRLCCTRGLVFAPHIRGCLALSSSARDTIVHSINVKSASATPSSPSSAKLTRPQQRAPATRIKLRTHFHDADND